MDNTFPMHRIRCHAKNRHRVHGQTGAPRPKALTERDRHNNTIAKHPRDNTMY